MLTENDVVLMIEGLERSDLLAWIDSGWVMPARRESHWFFAEIDVARVRFIHEMRYELSLDEEALPVILSLLDQLYGLRRELRQLTAAVQAEPEEVRRRIADHLRRLRGR